MHEEFNSILNNLNLLDVLLYYVLFITSINEYSTGMSGTFIHRVLI